MNLPARLHRASSSQRPSETRADSRRSFSIYENLGRIHRGEFGSTVFVRPKIYSLLKATLEPSLREVICVRLVDGVKEPCQKFGTNAQGEQFKFNSLSLLFVSAYTDDL